jgi:serine/threonine protein kinase
VRRLGDFGLATKHREKAGQDNSENAENDAVTSSLYDAIENIGRLVGASRSKNARHLLSPETSNANESMTGGVGTTFYRAPEQEGNVLRKKGHRYTVQADVRNLSLAEPIFRQPFSPILPLTDIQPGSGPVRDVPFTFFDRNGKSGDFISVTWG